MAFTEFCCRSGGSNLNAGTRTGNSTEPGTAADFTYTAGTWSSTARTFTTGAGSVDASIIAGDLVSIYDSTGSPTATGYLARVTSVTGTPNIITVSATVFAGTKPADIVGTAVCKVGGAWLGPNGASGFPFGVLDANLTNVAGNFPKVNMKNDQTYSISTGITQNKAGVLIEGYTSAYADGGRATIDGSTNAIVLLASTASSIVINLIAQNNGSSGTNAAFSGTGTYMAYYGCVANTCRGAGFSATPVGTVHFEDCEAYACNSAGTVSSGGFLAAQVATFVRCNAHDNSATNSNGFVQTAGIPHVFINCIAESNANDGILCTGASYILASGCDFYNNGRDGIELTNSGMPGIIENCNFIKNGRYGIEQAATATRPVFVKNCGYGAGTQANTTGTTNGGLGIQETGAVTYGSNLTPWVDPANGDFRINLAAAKGAGRGTFTETQASYAGTTGYPDIGAAQHLEATPVARFVSAQRGSPY